MKYKHHKYMWTNRFGNPNHHWEFVGPQGAVHFHATLVEGYGDSCGIEYHFFEPPHYKKGEAPDHIDCPLTGGKCWHDGSSLYASEHLWPVIRNLLKTEGHKAIFDFLEGEADLIFSRKDDE